MRTAWNTAARLHGKPVVPTTVRAYLDALETGRRHEFEQLRDWVSGVLPEARETMAYKVPTYEGAAPVCAIAAQKHHFALYVCETDVLERHRADFADLDLGKGCIRFRRVEDLPRRAARRLLREAAREQG